MSIATKNHYVDIFATPESCYELNDLESVQFTNDFYNSLQNII